MKVSTLCVWAISFFLIGCGDPNTQSDRVGNKLTFMGKSMSIYSGERCVALNAEVYINNADGSSPRLATLHNGVLNLNDVPEHGFITTRDVYDEGGSTGGNNPSYIYVVTSIQKEAISEDGIHFFEGMNNYDFDLGDACITIPIYDPTSTVVTNSDEYPSTVTIEYDGVPASFLGEGTDQIFTFSLGDTGVIDANSSYGVSNIDTVTINKSVVTYPIVGDYEKIDSYSATLNAKGILSKKQVYFNAPSELYLPHNEDITSILAIFKSAATQEEPYVWSEQRVLSTDGQFNMSFPSAKPIDSITVNDNGSMSFVTNYFTYDVIESKFTGINLNSTTNEHNIFQVTDASTTINVELPDQWKISEITSGSITLYNFDGNKDINLSIMAELRNWMFGVSIDPSSSAIYDYNKAIMNNASVTGASINL